MPQSLCHLVSSSCLLLQPLGCIEERVESLSVTVYAKPVVPELSGNLCKTERVYACPPLVQQCFSHMNLGWWDDRWLCQCLSPVFCVCVLSLRGLRAWPLSSMYVSHAHSYRGLLPSPLVIFFLTEALNILEVIVINNLRAVDSLWLASNTCGVCACVYMPSWRPMKDLWNVACDVIWHVIVGAVFPSENAV